LGAFPVLPIISGVSSNDALFVAEALIEGGVEIMEITLRSAESQESLSILRKEFPDLTLGAGSIIHVEQLNWAAGEGLDFAVSPAWNDLIWERSEKISIPLIPGILTPSELLHAINAGCLHPKIFPIEPAGGLPYLQSLLAPFQHTSIQCLPTGGIKKEQVQKYLNFNQVLTVGGSWITPPEMISAKNSKGITELAKSSIMIANC